MRFYEILGEGERTNNSTIPALLRAKDWGKIKTAVDQYHDGNVIYRGIRGGGIGVMYADPTQSVRRSANTSNHYTLLLDNFPSWQSFPKRSQSLICSSDWDAAAAYGQVYIVLPLDNPDVGICPQNDFWRSFQNAFIELKNIATMSQFNGQLRNLSRFLIHRVISDTSFDQMLADMNEMTAKWPEFVQEHQRKLAANEHLSESETYLETFSRWFAVDNNLYETLDEVLDPRFNHFDLVSLSSLGYADNDDREMWLSAPSFLVYPEVMEELIEKGKL